MKVSNGKKERGPAADAIQAPLLHRRFEMQAQLTPDKAALSDEGSLVSYSQLDQRANRVATLLSANGVAGGFVGLHMPRSVDYVAATLGVLKANAAVVPLPPSYPKHRLQEIVGAGALDTVIVSEDAPLPRGAARRVLHIRAADHEREACIPPVPSADGAAFVLSSSGSTGRPKLIVRSHRSFFHRLEWTWATLPFVAGEHCVQKSHMTTTHAIYELFEPLLRGVPTHVVSDEDVQQLGRFWSIVCQHGISRLLMVPSMLQASLDVPTFTLPPLTALILMGERVTPQLAERVLEAATPSTRIFSIYGSTEASSVLACDVRTAFRRGHELPLGRPIARDIRALALNQALQPVPEGGSGMLYIAGPALFSEYANDPEMTSAATVSHPDGRMYKTEDRVRVSSGGALEFVARTDDMVKIRGFRVDLNEVERTIAAQTSIGQCVVVARHDSRGRLTIVGFVTPSCAPTADVIQSLRETLPRYMIPATIVALDALPLTQSGKVDRRALASIPLRARNATTAWRSDTERIVAEVWQSVLGHDAFGRDSDFFGVGGSSLDVFAVVHRLAEAFQLGNALTELSMYRAPTLASLAASIEAIGEADRPTATPSNSVLVTLKHATSSTKPPLFLVSSAGGMLGAYAELVRSMHNGREIIGVRDPFLWNDRDPTCGFSAWVSRYVDAIRTRQPNGPYHLIAYSSAGAFGYEIARRLRQAGEEVPLLVLIDPLAMDRGSRYRFGHWALEARFEGRRLRWPVRAAAAVRRAAAFALPHRSAANDWRLSRDEFETLASNTRSDCAHTRRLSVLFELNTGLPFTLTADDVASTPPGQCLNRLLDRVRQLTPQANIDMIGRLAVQYQLQVRAQHQYRLAPYDGTVFLFEPDGPWCGLEGAQLRPYVRRLRSWSLSTGPAGRENATLEELFSPASRIHFTCIRDKRFVTSLAAEIDRLCATL